MKLKNLLVKESANTLDVVLEQLPMMAKKGVSKKNGINRYVMLKSIMAASETFDINDINTLKLIIKYKQYLPQEVVNMAEMLLYSF